MLNTRRLIGSGLFVLILFSTAPAQEKTTPIDNPQAPAQGALPGPAPAAPLVTATASAKRVRFVSPGTVVQLRLEVYNEAGQKLFDTELHGGNVLDWYLQDGAGQRLTSGSYASVLTIKSLSGRLSQRVGVVTVNNEKAAIEPLEGAQFSIAQQQSIGPVEGNSAFTILQESDAEAITAVTHDGNDGQVSRTRGALSFRVGDIFSGKDKEQMRLTEDGRVGIGTSDPQAKLDVAGTIRAERFLVAKPVKPGGASQSLTADIGQAGNDEQSLVAGSGTQDRIAKWIDNAGTLGDSGITETAGNVGIGTTTPGAKLDISGGSSQAVLTVNGTNNPEIRLQHGGSTLFEIGIPTASGNYISGSSVNDVIFKHTWGQKILFSTSTAGSPNDLTLSAGKVGIGTISPGERLEVVGNIKASGSLTSATGSITGNLTVDTNTLHVDATNNRVGVGTTAPGSPLDVVGDINTSTHYNIGGSRVFSIDGTSNTFAGINVGTSNTTGHQNSFFGNSAGAANSSGASNSFFGVNAGNGNTSGGGNSFFGTDAGVTSTTAHFNAFFGNQAGRNNTTGGNNAFFGQNSGFANTTASNNSFFGQAAGFANTTGSYNSFFGTSAGLANTTGLYNSFFGYRAGAAATGDTASANSFFGTFAGTFTTTGKENSFFGTSAGQFNETGEQNSFFGTSAGFSNLTGSNNSFFGRLAGNANTTGSNNSFFGNAAGFNNTASANSFFGNNAGNANTSGQSNSFFGNAAGIANTTGFNNSFFGAPAGSSNSTGSHNSFFGQFAGSSNTTASNNSFFGQNAGFSNTTGNFNDFFGQAAGATNTTGSNNTFFGVGAGNANTTANSNAFFGNVAGRFTTTGEFNSFFGSSAGFNNTTGGSNSVFGSFAGFYNTTGTFNSFVGYRAGLSNTTEHNNSFLGSLSQGAAGITNATAVGFLAQVTQSNSLVLGSINTLNGATADTNVGIGTTAPNAKLHVVGGDVAITTLSTGVILRATNGGNCYRVTVDNAGALTTALLPCP